MTKKLDKQEWMRIRRMNMRLDLQVWPMLWLIFLGRKKIPNKPVILAKGNTDREIALKRRQREEAEGSTDSKNIKNLKMMKPPTKTELQKAEGTTITGICLCKTYNCTCIIPKGIVFRNHQMLSVLVTP